MLIKSDDALSMCVQYVCEVYRERDQYRSLRNTEQ